MHTPKISSINPTLKLGIDLQLFIMLPETAEYRCGSISSSSTILCINHPLCDSHFPDGLSPRVRTLMHTWIYSPLPLVLRSSSAGGSFRYILDYAPQGLLRPHHHLRNSLSTVLLLVTFSASLSWLAWEHCLNPPAYLSRMSFLTVWKWGERHNHDMNGTQVRKKGKFIFCS
jgi:hypothetical protein